ncbi:tRNA(adenine34) deaminase [Ligilactobacillus sp. WC1T17]|uniref:tRNA-specific adenosine deaminase n=1 Tax=Ligilactobacillus ruminis TaxID=1623 RepID=A0ABY1AC22_9LACO|nr:tRNA(adenine34) deaminase [Ligilactobacillus ruminis]
MDEKWMKEALNEAQKAYDLGEVPIGCVIVHQGKIVGRGHNLRETTHNALAHAECLAIKQANMTLDSWRLDECDLYVTLEPCPMCSGAIINARIKNIYYGASDLKAGVCGTLMNLVTDPRFNHQAHVKKGLCEAKCRQLLEKFFSQLRA